MNLARRLERLEARVVVDVAIDCDGRVIEFARQAWKALVQRRDQIDDWDNYRIQDPEIGFIADQSRFVMTCNMMDMDGNPGGDFPGLPGFTRVIGVFFSDYTLATIFADRFESGDLSRWSSMTAVDHRGERPQIDDLQYQAGQNRAHLRSNAFAHQAAAEYGVQLSKISSAAREWPSGAQ